MATVAVCGFPSPADDYMDRPLDMNELLIENLAATFCVRFKGDSMIGAGIFDGDIGVVNRAREAVDGSIIVAVLDGEFTTKRYRCGLDRATSNLTPLPRRLQGRDFASRNRRP